MAKSPDVVIPFLSDLSTKMEPIRDAERSVMLALKKAEKEAAGEACLLLSLLLLLLLVVVLLVLLLLLLLLLWWLLLLSSSCFVRRIPPSFLCGSLGRCRSEMVALERPLSVHLERPLSVHTLNGVACGRSNTHASRGVSCLTMHSGHEVPPPQAYDGLINGWDYRCAHRLVFPRWFRVSSTLSVTHLPSIT
jgi:hypothetical protein